MCANGGLAAAAFIGGLPRSTPMAAKAKTTVRVALFGTYTAPFPSTVDQS